MKTLRNHVIIYDCDCPMCDLYTSAFVKTGMLDQDGRKAYSRMDPFERSALDTNRARNEIALVNTCTGEVTYGIDSMFLILGHRFSLLKWLFSVSLFRNIMKRVYSFISYNRKVIAPASSMFSSDACIPDFNRSYRLLFIATAILVSSIMIDGLVAVAFHISNPLLLVVLGIGIVAASVTVGIHRQQFPWEYVGNVATVLIIVGVLCQAATLLPVQTALWGFGIIGSIGVCEYLRRCKIYHMVWPGLTALAIGFASGMMIFFMMR